MKEVNELLLPFMNLEFTIPISNKILNEAINIATNLNKGKSINDVLHSIYASKYCDKLVTFDKGFKTFIGLRELDIELL